MFYKYTERYNILIDTNMALILQWTTTTENQWELCNKRNKHYLQILSYISCNRTINDL